MSGALNGKVALVTGAAHRIGRVIALELAQRGAHILLHYHRASAAQVQATRQDIESFGVTVHSARADLSQADGIDTLFDAWQKNFDRLDIVVNNASVFQKRNLLEVSLADWDLTMAVNLRAPFLITQRAAGLMAQQKPAGGVIINICDAGADGPWKEYAHHGISKSALWMLTQVSALALGPAVRVNAIVPGPMLKTAGSPMSDADWARSGERTVLRRTGSPADVARAVAYLCGEDFITGALLHVNGGEHLP